MAKKPSRAHPRAPRAAPGPAFASVPRGMILHGGESLRGPYPREIVSPQRVLREKAIMDELTHRARQIVTLQRPARKRALQVARDKSEWIEKFKAKVMPNLPSPNSSPDWKTVVLQRCREQGLAVSERTFERRLRELREAGVLSWIRTPRRS